MKGLEPTQKTCIEMLANRLSVGLTKEQRENCILGVTMFDHINDPQWRQKTVPLFNSLDWATGFMAKKIAEKLHVPQEQVVTVDESKRLQAFLEIKIIEAQKYLLADFHDEFRTPPFSFGENKLAFMQSPAGNEQKAFLIQLIGKIPTVP